MKGKVCDLCGYDDPSIAQALGNCLGCDTVVSAVDPRVDILAEALSRHAPLRARPEVRELYERDARALLARLDAAGRSERAWNEDEANTGRCGVCGGWHGGPDSVSHGEERGR